MVLRIIDCSNLIYAGYYGNRRQPKIGRGMREVDGMWEDTAIPFSGVLFALKFIKGLKDDNTMIIPVFDRPPEIKKQMYSDAYGKAAYKAGRGSNATPQQRKDIHLNKKWTEDILRKCGFNCQAVDGYEADDIIYTLVEYYKGDFEEIIVHTKDSDLSFIVDDHVSIEKAGNSGKDINKANYYLTAKTNATCLYNTVHFHKLYKGDTADNIPGIGYDWADRFVKMFTNEDMAKLGNLSFARECLRKMVQEYSLEPGASLVLPTFNILCPLTVPEEELDLFETEPDWEQLEAFWLNGCAQEFDRWGCEDLVEEFIEEYYD